MTLRTAMDRLQEMADPQSKKNYTNHGANENIFGVSVTNLRALAAEIGMDTALAKQLYATGHFDAMHLAPMIADPRAFTEDELSEMAKAAYCHVLSDYAVASLTAEQPAEVGMRLSQNWIGSGDASMAAAGWTALGMMLAIHDDGDFSERDVTASLHQAMMRLPEAEDRVKFAMHGFVVSAAVHYAPAREIAMDAARQMGVMRIRLAASGYKRVDAPADIARAIARGSLGKKRRSFR